MIQIPTIGYYLIAIPEWLVSTLQFGWYFLICYQMFNWGRHYERKQAAKHWEPKEPTL